MDYLCKKYTELINNLLQTNLIRDVHLGVCSEKECKPDSIRKYL